VGAGPGGEWNSIDATLKLGQDLRRPDDRVVLRYRTNGTNPPYLRAATLSTFDGSIWRPDTGRPVDLGQQDALDTIVVDDGIRLNDGVATIEVENLLSGWLPVPYPAVEIEGLEGTWGALQYNRTIISEESTANGQTYAVNYTAPRPTLEQIRSKAAEGSLREATQTLPDGMPEAIDELAREVTAEFDTDYDKLLALQRWFRGPDFEYSPDAPVEEGFDGTGVQALERFLDVKQGNCIHFAAAFALMARTLDMPSRIVVGYLPGVASSTQVPGETVYVVSSSLLHAWPEVFFRGVGWVPFEPTKSLGNPTSFVPESVVVAEEEGESATATPSASASASSSLNPRDENPEEAGGAGSPNDYLRPLPWLGTILAILLVLLIPAAIQAYRRREMLAAAGSGDAAAAWRLLQDTAIDLAIPLPQGESARGFATRMIRMHGVPPDDMWALLAAIERASYSPSSSRRDLHDLAPPAAAVRAAMVDSVDRSRQIMAVMAPRSLVVKPGSLYAAGARTAGA
jgi:transglutaminase-like putative cysteine protease